jgi:hypothetical protein
MELFEQRFVIKFFFLQGFGNKMIHSKLVEVLGDKAYSITQIKYWLAKFKAKDFSCLDDFRAGRPSFQLNDSLVEYLRQFPFASAKQIAKHFYLSQHTVKEILQRELGFKKYKRKWIPHLLTEPQKSNRVQCAQELLQTLENESATDFEGVVTGDETWLLLNYQSNSMFSDSRASVPPMVRQNIASKKYMITVFFTGTRIIVTDLLNPHTTFNQDYFIAQIIPGLYNHQRNLRRRKHQIALQIHMDNSMCHNGRKVTQEFERKKMIRLPHPAYSPDISPCDFWFFGFLKEKLKNIQLSTPEDISCHLCRIWNEVPLAEVQSVFYQWMDRLKWVIEHGGEYYPE